VSFGLVLGAGGLVGIAHHVGVLWALEREAGIVPDKAELIIGTSAGSVAAAYLRSGWSTEELHERIRVLPAVAPVAVTSGVLDLASHIVGSAYVLARSTVPTPALWPKIPRAIRRHFPAGLVSSGDAPRVLEMDLPRSWPARQLWVCSLDLVSGRRVVFGSSGALEVPLPLAVQASCAIPGFYPPVRIGDRIFVDGGAYSPTNLDLVVESACDFVICVSPMSHAPNPFVGPHWRVLRALPTMALRREVEIARKAGKRLVIVAPGSHELRAQGLNPMRATGLDAVVDAAYEATARMIDRSGLGSTFAEHAAA
jgi:NTE family protein